MERTKALSSTMIRYTYLGILFLLAITGFGQMPIFKRYYIADIPGFGWLAQFYTTHFLHYLAAAVFMGITAYLIAEHFLVHRKRVKVTPSGYLRASILAGIVITGIFLVLRNSLFAPFSPEAIIALDIAHLGLVMLFLVVGLFCIILKKRWMAGQ